MKTQAFKHSITLTIIATMVVSLATVNGYSQQRQSENPYRKSTPVLKEPNKQGKQRKDQAHDKRDNTCQQQAQTQRNNYNYYYHKPTTSHKHYQNPKAIHETVHCNIKPYPYKVNHNCYTTKLKYRHIPRQAIRVVLDDQLYYFFNGQFFAPTHRGYFVTEPPRLVKHLPRGCKEVWVYGKSMFRYQGIYFIAVPHGFTIHI